MTKRKARKIIKAFLENLKRPVFKKEYLQYHQNRIHAVEWLLAYYENRAAATPQELLDSFLKDTNSFTMSVDDLKSTIIWIDVLYNWVMYKRISGF